MAPGMTNGICGIENSWDALPGRIPINDHFPKALPSATKVQAVGLQSSERVASTTIGQHPLRRSTGAEGAYHYSRGQRPRLPMKKKYALKGQSSRPAVPVEVSPHIFGGVSKGTLAPISFRRVQTPCGIPAQRLHDSPIASQARRSLRTISNTKLIFRGRV